MDGLEEKRFKTSRGVNYRYYITPAGSKDAEKPVLMMHHGWPDGAHLWVKVIPHLKNLSNRLFIPDLLGYGGTDKPTDPKDYAFDAMSNDMAEILDSEKISNVISIGHDWGCGSAERFYNFKPDRTVALIMLNVSYIAPDKQNPFNLETVNKMTKQVYGYSMYEYWNLFTSSEAPKIFDENLERVWDMLHNAEYPGGEAMRNYFCVPGACKEYLTNHDLGPLKQKHYSEDPELKKPWLEMMKSGGFEAPFCWYRAMVDGVQFESDQAIKDENMKVNVPALYVGCTNDYVCRPEFIHQPKEAGLLPDLKIETIESAHWCLYEKPAEVAKCITSFIEEKGL